jgi:hypothetical protein
MTLEHVKQNIQGEFPRIAIKKWFSDFPVDSFSRLGLGRLAGLKDVLKVG